MLGSLKKKEQQVSFFCEECCRRDPPPKVFGFLAKVLSQVVIFGNSGSSVRFDRSWGVTLVGDEGFIWG